MTVDRNLFDPAAPPARLLFARRPRGAACVHAETFGVWAAELCARAEQHGTVVALNQAKLLLLDRYFLWRAAVSTEHRDLMRAGGHHCIWHTFSAHYERLRMAELTLAPPPLVAETPVVVALEPSNVAEAEPPQRGIFLAPTIDA